MSWATIDQRFAQHLMDAGLITQRDYHKALRMCASMNMPIGSMAYQRSLLTYHDIVRIIDYQVENDLMFGEAAVKLGLLTQQEVDSLLAQQAKLRVSVYDMLVSMGALDRQRLKEEYKLFLKEQVKKDTETVEF
ncbi:MAG: hypothetical protein FJ278_08600 [Planctomycetes bacterium]|nr:hypothetical protein [Planctomycetota bacterium]